MAERLDRALAMAVDAGLATAVFVVPLLMGGRHPLGELVLVFAAVLAALAWLCCCLREQTLWRRSPGEWLLAAGLLLLVVQLVPLGEWLLARLNSHIPRLLPLWTSAADSECRLGVWRCLSLTPGATRAAAALALAYGLLFLVAVQRIERIRDVERLLRWTALSAAGMAAFGLVQWLASNGKFFWFYQHPFVTTSDAVHGAFSNRNHLAHFLALGLGPIVWWLQDALRKSKRREQESFLCRPSADGPRRWLSTFRLGRSRRAADSLVGRRLVRGPDVALPGRRWPCSPPASSASSPTIAPGPWVVASRSARWPQPS